MVFLKGFVCAARGLWYCVRHERNFRIHTAVGICVLLFAPRFSLSRGEWAALFAVLALVPALEAVNTAVEKAVDLASPRCHPLARAAKDAAAGAVLLSACFAVAIGIALFARWEVWLTIFNGWKTHLWKPVLLLAYILLALWFIVKGGDQTSPPPDANSHDAQIH